MAANTVRAAAIRWISAERGRLRADHWETGGGGVHRSGHLLRHRRPLPEPPPAVCYRNDAGQCWDGQGEMPDWRQRAVG